DQRQDKRLALQRQLAEVQAAQRQVLEAQGRLVELQQQRGQTLLQQGHQRLALLQQERGRQAGVVPGGTERVRGAQARFGELDPVARAKLLDVARKLRGAIDNPNLGPEALPGLGAAAWMQPADMRRFLGGMAAAPDAGRWWGPAGPFDLDLRQRIMANQVFG